MNNWNLEDKDKDSRLATCWMRDSLLPRTLHALRLAMHMRCMATAWHPMAWATHAADDGVLSSLQALRANLCRLKRRQCYKEEWSPAAVLVPLLRNKRGELEILYTLRAATMRSHSGEVSFPGGRADEVDNGDTVTTALRETKEEVGVDVHRESSILGLLHDVTDTATRTVVTPVVAFLGSRSALEVRPSEMEIQEIFWETVSTLRATQETEMRRGRLLPVFAGARHCIWGMTAVITKDLLNILPS